MTTSEHDKWEVFGLAEAAFRKAAVTVVERARQSGTTIVLWEDGRVVEVSPEEVDIESLRNQEG